MTDTVRFLRAINRETVGITGLGAGEATSCPICFGRHLYDTKETCPDEGWFSRQPCDSCGTKYAGNRYAAHGFDEHGGIIHLDVCADCLCYFANGDLPEHWNT